MTREEAIQWLEQIKERYIIGGDEKFDSSRKEALDMAISALRAQPPKLDRSRWERCEVCCFESCEICRYDGDFDTCASCFRDICDEYEPLNFCPNCGRPLTEEAWAELERRIT